MKSSRIKSGSLAVDTQVCSMLLVHAVSHVLQAFYLPGATSEMVLDVGAMHLVSQLTMLVARAAHLLMLPHHHNTYMLCSGRSTWGADYRMVLPLIK